jgi:hypothetical protein
MDSKGIKQLLGEIPLTVELYWLLRQRNQPLRSHFILKNLQMTLPDACSQVKPFALKAPTGKKVFIFATLHFWIEHAAMLGMALAGKGHRVTLAYLPFSEWHKPISKFDLRRQNLYARQVLQEASPYLKPVSFLDVHPIFQSLPQELADAVDQVTMFDTQYTLQVEDVNRQDPIYLLCQERNLAAAKAALNWLKGHRPDVVIVPNGTIQEFGVVYRVARYLEIPVVTYEFGDQRERIWLAQNGEIMRHETDALWEARRDIPLLDSEVERLNALFAARMQAATWENFSRLWQGTPAQGGSQVRASLGLDDRPVVLLATNVLGDSLTLGRQVFSQSMEEWIARTVQYFAGREDTQLVIRVHPGEALTHGTSMVDVVHKTLPELPEHIHLIGPVEKVNTYDLVDVADVGLVYTTTVGMEMAMSGKPVLIAGQTHYRGRGFTFDPQTWDDYFEQLDTLLTNPSAHRLTKDQIDLAWQYAYRFFFEFPFPFPWHLVRFWDDYKARPISYVLGEEGAGRYETTFRYLAGEPIDWTKGLTSR